MRLVIIAAGIIFAAIVMLLLLGLGLSRSVGKKAGRIIKAIEQKYHDYMEKKISTILLDDQQDEIDVSGLEKEIIILIKPEMEALIAQINANTYSDVSIKLEAPRFHNLASTAELLFEKRGNNKTQSITEEDEQKLFDTIKDAVRADLVQRKVDWNLTNS